MRNLLQHNSYAGRWLTLCLFLAAVFHTPVGAQSLDSLYRAFDAFEQRTDEEYEAFRRRTQKEFGEFLKQSWQEFEVMQGEEPPTAPKPVTPRVAGPEIFDKMIRIPDGQVQVMPVMQENAPLPKPSNNKPSTKYGEVSVPFFGSWLNLPFDRKFVAKLRSAKEPDVGDYWVGLADADFLLLIYSCRLVKDVLCLNDWGYYQLVAGLAQQMYPRGMDDERTVFTAFVLDETGYDVRIARNAATGKLIMMSVFESSLYLTPYLDISRKRYYMPGAVNKNERIASYRSYAKGQKRRIDLKIAQPLKLKNAPGTFEIAANVIGTPLKITYNRNAVDFYATIPVTDVEVYFNSCGSAVVQQSLEAALKPVVEGKTETDAVGALLRMMHHAFAYKTDEEQFGRERPFFFEELFAYPYCDCEDRSVLFAFMVRQLTGLQVVGLKYPGHVATAVKFNGRANGHYIHFDGGDYIICDPTNINGVVGQCMEGYETASPRLIAAGN